MPIDAGELPKEFTEYASSQKESLLAERENQAWELLEGTLKKYTEVAKILYPERAQDIKVSNMISNMPTGRGGQTNSFGYWEVTFDGKSMVFPNIAVGGETKLLLPDGTMYTVEERRWGDADLKVDARLHILSDEVFGTKYPIFSGAVEHGQTIDFDNHHSSRHDNEIYGLGKKLEVAGHDFKIEYSTVMKNSPSSVLKVEQDLNSTFESKVTA